MKGDSNWCTFWLVRGRLANSLKFRTNKGFSSGGDPNSHGLA